MPSPDISTLAPDSMAVGGAGADAARGDDEWLRVYGRVVAMLPRVEALAAAGRARLEAVNELQHEFWEARDALLQQRLLQAEESRRRWEAAYIELQPSGGDRRFAELQKSDFEDLTTFVDVLAAENAEFQVKLKEVKGGMEHSQNAADNENITRDLKTELWKLKQTYQAVCSVKNNIVSQVTAERDFFRYQFKTLERDSADLLSHSNKKAARATEAEQEIQQNIKQLQVASQKKDDEIRRLRVQAKAKAAEAKRKLVPESRLQKVDCMPKELQDRQPETSQKHKKDLSETHTKGCSEGPALRPEAKDYSSKKMLAEDGQPEASQKRKCVGFSSNDGEQNGNACRTSNKVLEPLKKKRVSGEREMDQENNKELPSGKIHEESDQSPQRLSIYNSLLYLHTLKESFSDKPEKYKEFLAVQREFVSRKIGIDAFVSAVKVLLDGHPELIRGFKSCFTCTPTHVLENTNTKS